MNYKIGIIWALIITTVASTGTVIYNNLKVKDAHNLVGALGANVISSLFYGSSGSSGGYVVDPKPKVYGYCGGLPMYSPTEICCGDTEIYTNGYFSVPSKNPIDPSYPATHKKVCCNNKVVEVGNDNEFEGTVCCQNSGIVKEYDKSDWIFGPTGVGMLDEKKLCEGCANRPNPIAPAWCVTIESELTPKLPTAVMMHREWNEARCMYGDFISNVCAIGSTCSADKTMCLPPAIKVPSINSSETQSIINLINPYNNNTDQSATINLSNPTTTKSLLPTNIFQQTLPFVGPVQTPPSSIAPSYASKPAASSVLKKAPSAEVCNAAGLPTAFTCKAYTASASTQINPAYLYKGVTYSLSYTRHKNTKGAACRDLCVATAKK